MIGYETKENFYIYKMENLERVVDMIHMIQNMNQYTQESVLSLLDVID